MMAGLPVRVALIGLGFGAEFIPIYQRHPQAELAAIRRRDRAGLDEVGDQFGVERRYPDYREAVSCFGSGTIGEELIERYGSPFAVESALKGGELVRLPEFTLGDR